MRFDRTAAHRLFRFIQAHQPDWNEREYKIDYADRPFSFSADVDSGIITLDDFTMNLKTKDYRGKVTSYNYNRAVLLMKCADEAFEQGLTVTPPIPSRTLLPFKLDNRTRFQYNIEVAPLYKQYAAQDQSLTIDMKNIRCSKFNEYGDVINAGSYDLHCELCSTSQIFEIMKLQASWIDDTPYIKTLFCGIENYAPILGSGRSNPRFRCSTCRGCAQGRSSRQWEFHYLSVPARDYAKVCGDLRRRK